MTEDPRAAAWAMPGSAVEQEDVPPAVAGTPAGPVVTPGAEPTDDRPAVPRVALRPMTVADVLDGAFTVIKARPRRVLTFAAGFVVPVQLLLAFLLRRDASDIDEVWFSPGAFTAGATVNWWNLAASLVLPAVALVCVAAGLSHLVSGWTVGRDATGREMLAVVGRRWWALLGSFVVVHVAEAIAAAACYVPLLFVMPLFLVVAPVIGTEQGSAIEAVSRSARLTASRYWRSMGIVVLTAVVSGLLSLALASLPQGVAGAIGLDRAWALYALGGILAELVVVPFVAAATVLYYLDLRVRIEGLDLDISARDVLDPAA